jgi:hypothetical protein
MQRDQILIDALVALRRREDLAPRVPVHGDLRLDQFLTTPDLRLYLTDGNVTVKLWGLKSYWQTMRDLRLWSRHIHSGGASTARGCCGYVDKQSDNCARSLPEAQP